MALVEGCKHSLEISIPVDVVESETSRVVDDIQKRARLPGFRPGKAPANLIRKQFAGDIRQKVLEHLIPIHLQKQLDAENLSVVGTPDISDVHFHDFAPLKFKANFEVFPEIELGEYTNVEVPYQDPEVTEEDIAKRIDEIREQKAQYVNIDPRPVADGDFAVVSLESLTGVEGEPVKTDEMVLEIGARTPSKPLPRTCAVSRPGDEKDFEVVYPEDYGSEKLAGKTVKFHAVLKGLRRKELPELNDEFAQDLGDYRTVDELRGSRPQGHLRPAPVRGAAGSQEQDRRQTGGCARFSGTRGVRRTADQEPRRAEPARHGGAGRRSWQAQAGLGKGKGIAAR